MLMKCTYNFQYIAHYAQVELTIILIKTDIRYEETQLHYFEKPVYENYNDIHIVKVLIIAHLWGRTQLQV